MKVAFCLDHFSIRQPAEMEVLPVVGDEIDFSGADDELSLFADVRIRTFNVVTGVWMLHLDVSKYGTSIAEAPDAWRGAGFDVPAGDAR